MTVVLFSQSTAGLRRRAGRLVTDSPTTGALMGSGWSVMAQHHVDEVTGLDQLADAGEESTGTAMAR